jgi:hypothetical protein
VWGSLSICGVPKTERTVLIRGKPAAINPGTI